MTSMAAVAIVLSILRIGSSPEAGPKSRQASPLLVQKRGSAPGVPKPRFRSTWGDDMRGIPAADNPARHRCFRRRRAAGPRFGKGEHLARPDYFKRERLFV